MLNSEEKGAIPGNGGNLPPCERTYSLESVTGPFPNVYYSFLLPQPAKQDVRKFLENTGKSYEEIENMVKNYCDLREGSQANRSPFLQWCLKNEVDIKWIEESLNKLLLNLQHTKPYKTLSEKMYIFEDFLLQRGWFGDEGLDIDDWMKKNELYAGDKLVNHVPSEKAMKKYESKIRKALSHSSTSLKTEMIDKFRQDAAGFTSTVNFESWFEDNILSNTKCICPCTKKSFQLAKSVDLSVGNGGSNTRLQPRMTRIDGDVKKCMCACTESDASLPGSIGLPRVRGSSDSKNNLRLRPRMARENEPVTDDSSSNSTLVADAIGAASLVSTVTVATLSAFSSGNLSKGLPSSDRVPLGTMENGTSDVAYAAASAFSGAVSAAVGNSGADFLKGMLCGALCGVSAVAGVLFCRNRSSRASNDAENDIELGYQGAEVDGLLAGSQGGNDEVVATQPGGGGRSSLRAELESLQVTGTCQNKHSGDKCKEKLRNLEPAR